MDLKIFIKDRRVRNDKGIKYVWGQIEIGSDLKETLYIPLDFWSIENYEQQWKEGLDRLKTWNESCLVATVHGPLVGPYVNWWPLYKIGNKVYIRNYLFVGEIYTEAVGDAVFNMQTCYDFIPPRIVNKKPSEWVIDYS